VENGMWGVPEQSIAAMVAQVLGTAAEDHVPEDYVAGHSREKRNSLKVYREDSGRKSVGD